MGNFLSGFLSSKSDPEELRQKANDLFVKAKQLSAQSQLAYKQGNGAEAKLLSKEKHRVYAEAEQLNLKAKQLLFKQANQYRGLDEIQECREHDITKLIIITGRGNRSENQIAKIKPKIVELAVSHGFEFQVNEPNQGCITLIVHSEKKRGLLCCYL